MSKLLAGIVAVGLVLVSFGIIGGPFEKDAHAEDAYAKYNGVGEMEPYTWWGIESPATSVSIVLKYTCLEFKDGEYRFSIEESSNGNLDVDGMTIEDVLGDLSIDSFERTDKRVGIGGTVTYQWEYIVGNETYHILSSEDVIDTIHRFTASSSDEEETYEHIVDLNADGIVLTWAYHDSFHFELWDTEVAYVRDLPGDAVTEDTKFGKKDIIRDDSGKAVFADSKVYYERYYNGINYTLSATNIKL